MENSGGNKPSGGTSRGTRLVVFGVAAGALGYAVIYFFDHSLGEERRRRVLEAAQAAMQEVMLLSQRLVAGTAAPEAAPEPERARTAVPVGDRPRDYHEPVPAREMTDSLHEKVTFFRLGDEEADEAPVLAPVAVIAEELPAASPRPQAARHEPRNNPPSLAPTIIAYDADPAPAAEPVPEPELPAAGEPRTGRTLLAAAAVVAVLAAAAALGAWAIWSGGDSKPAAAPAPAGAAQLVSLISQPGAHRLPVAGSKGTMVLVTTPSGRAVLIISGLKRAPAGKVYQAWIVRGKTPASAGLFKGGQPQYVIPLSGRMPKGAVFAVTVERAGGVPAPTQAPEFTAKMS
jgi:hypothetical protein